MMRNDRGEARPLVCGIVPAPPHCGFALLRGTRTAEGWSEWTAIQALAMRRDEGSGDLAPDELVHLAMRNVVGYWQMFPNAIIVLERHDGILPLADAAFAGWRSVERQLLDAVKPVFAGMAVDFWDRLKRDFMERAGPMLAGEREGDLLDVEAAALALSAETFGGLCLMNPLHPS